MIAPTAARLGGLSLAMGLTLSLLAVDLLRLPLGGEGLPLPVIVLVVTAAALVIRSWVGMRAFLVDATGRMTPILLACGLFWACHLLACMRADELMPALLDQLKLSLGMICFATILLVSNHLVEGLDRMWFVHFWVASILLVALIYRYAFVFDMPFLGVSWDLPTRLGKNQLGWFLAVTLPYLLVLYVTRRRGAIVLLLCLVHAIAWIYTASRGSWFCGAIGCAVALLATRPWLRGSVLLGRVARLIVSVVLLVLIAWLIVGAHLDLQTLDLISRITGEEDGVSQTSDRVRIEMMERYVDLFEQQPLLGQGLRNSFNSQDYLSHNDYLALMADLGVLGLTSFGLLLTLSLATVAMHDRNRPYVAGSKGSVVAMVLYLAFINVYLSPMFWILLGLAVSPAVAARHDTRLPVERA